MCVLGSRTLNEYDDDDDDIESDNESDDHVTASPKCTSKKPSKRKATETRNKSDISGTTVFYHSKLTFDIFSLRFCEWNPNH